MTCPVDIVHTVVDKQDKITKLLQKFQLVQLVGGKKGFDFTHSVSKLKCEG